MGPPAFFGKIALHDAVNEWLLQCRGMGCSLKFLHKTATGRRGRSRSEKRRQTMQTMTKQLLLIAAVATKTATEDHVRRHQFGHDEPSPCHTHFNANRGTRSRRQLEMPVVQVLQLQLFFLAALLWKTVSVMRRVRAPTFRPPTACRFCPNIQRR